MNGNGEMMIYIDGAHMVHMDTCGHSGLYATMGKGAMLNVAKKLGMVTISSTETEVVSTGERLPKCTWFRYMRLAQGEEMSEGRLMQDNKSSIFLQNNYPFSVRKGSKHIHVRFYISKEKIDKKELKIVYCPKDDITADFNTKPLQGSKFVEFCDKLLGISAEDFDEYNSEYIKVLKSYDLYNEELEKDLFR